MPTKLCIGRKGVIVHMMSQARGDLNGQPMLQPKELSSF
jgi:hypothetical protein